MYWTWSCHSMAVYQRKLNVFSIYCHCCSHIKHHQVVPGFACAVSVSRSQYYSALCWPCSGFYCHNPNPNPHVIQWQNTYLNSILGHTEKSGLIMCLCLCDLKKGKNLYLPTSSTNSLLVVLFVQIITIRFKAGSCCNCRLCFLPTVPEYYRWSIAHQRPY